MENKTGLPMGDPSGASRLRSVDRNGAPSSTRLWKKAKFRGKFQRDRLEVVALRRGMTMEEVSRLNPGVEVDDCSPGESFRVEALRRLLRSSDVPTLVFCAGPVPVPIPVPTQAAGGRSSQLPSAGPCAL
eukprot:384057-Prorocentrum_minimum.AAC.1